MEKSKSEDEDESLPSGTSLRPDAPAFAPRQPAELRPHAPAFEPRQPAELSLQRAAAANAALAAAMSNSTTTLQDLSALLELHGPHAHASVLGSATARWSVLQRQRAAEAELEALEADEGDGTDYLVGAGEEGWDGDGYGEWENVEGTAGYWQNEADGAGGWLGGEGAQNWINTAGVGYALQAEVRGRGWGGKPGRGRRRGRG